MLVSKEFLTWLPIGWWLVVFFQLVYKKLWIFMLISVYQIFMFEYPYVIETSQ